MPKPTKEELANMHWRDRYEYESAQKNRSLDKLSEQELVERIEGNNLDHYFAIWQVLGRKGTIAHAVMPMWRYLQRSPGERNMLNRYHCAAALFTILDMPDPASKSDLRKQVQWDSLGEDARQAALLRLRTIIEEQLALEKDID